MEEPIKLTTEKEVSPKRNTSHEELFGKLVIFVVFLFFVVIVGVIAFAAYRIMENGTDLRDSIVALKVEEMAKPVTEVAVPDPKPATEEPKAKLSTEILVLNGGGPKGSAGALGTALKKAGYEKVEVGNAALDYSGTTVYSSKELEAVALEVKKDILKQYPKAEWAEADPKKPETAKSAIVIVLGS